MFSARNRKNLAARQDIHFLWYPRAMYIFISLIKILFILVCAWLCVLGISFAVSFSNWTAKVFGESIRGRTKDYSTGRVLRAALEFWPSCPQNFCRTHSFQFAFVLSIFGQLPSAPCQHVLPWPLTGFKPHIVPFTYPLWLVLWGRQIRGKTKNKCCSNAWPQKLLRFPSNYRGKVLAKRH